MGPDDPALQPLIVLRVVIRSPDLDTFIAKYSRFIKDDRIFIFTKSSQPPGTRVRFTLELADGQPLIHGEGTVTRIRPDSGDPTKPPGMELKFVPLDEASRALVGRMLHAREATGSYQAVQVGPSGQFREETTDAQTNVRDGSTSSAMPREFDESVPTLQPLERTGAQQALSDEPPRRQDESGAVTLAQGHPHEQTAPDAPPSLPQPPSLSAPLNVANDKQSGGFSTPTPLPAPIPAAGDEFTGSPPPTKLARPSQSDAVTDGYAGAVRREQRARVRCGRAGAGVRRGVSRADSGSAVAVDHAADGHGSGQSVQRGLRRRDRVLRRVVARALDGAAAQGRAGALRQRGDGDSRAERRRSMRGPLLGGIAIGIFLGLPLGGAIVWFGRRCRRR